MMNIEQYFTRQPTIEILDTIYGESKPLDKVYGVLILDHEVTDSMHLTYKYVCENDIEKFESEYEYTDSTSKIWHLKPPKNKSK